MKNFKVIHSINILALATVVSCSPEFVNPNQSLIDAGPLPKSNVSVRSFDQVNETMSALTGINISKLPARSQTVDMITTRGNDFIRPEGGGLKYELPSNNSLAEFNASHQGAIVRMAAMYCNQYIDAERLAGRGPASVDALNASLDSIIEGYYEKFWGTCAVKPELDAAQSEVRSLLADLQGVSAGDNADEYLKLACSVFLSSSCVTMF